MPSDPDVRIYHRLSEDDAWTIPLATRGTAYDDTLESGVGSSVPLSDVQNDIIRALTHVSLFLLAVLALLVALWQPPLPPPELDSLNLRPLARTNIEFFLLYIKDSAWFPESSAGRLFLAVLCLVVAVSLIRSLATHALNYLFGVRAKLDRDSESGGVAVGRTEDGRYITGDSMLSAMFL